MQLKSKLMVAFLLMLVLTGITALMGWKSMSSMYYQSNMTSHVEASLTEMLMSQSRQLLYTMTRDRTFVALTKESLGIGLQEITIARELANDTARIRLIDEGVTFFKWYDSQFDKMVRQIDAMNVNDKELIDITRAIVASIGTLRANVEADIRREFTPARFNGFIEISAANEMYADTRAAYRAFLNSPTTANAEVTLACLKKTADRVSAAKGLLTNRQNLDLAEKTLQLLSDSTKGFLKTRESAQGNLALTLEIRDQVTKNITQMMQLSDSATQSIRDAKASGSFQMTGVAILSLLVGLGIAFFISGSVQLQLGKDPGELVRIAQRVTEGDYTIADGSKPVGVYGNILSMVASLRELVENSRNESERAHGESLKAREAMVAAEEAEQQAEVKSRTLLATAGKLEGVVNIISTASSQLTAQIAQSGQGASQQAHRVMETAAAMDEMNTTVLEVARNASAASNVSSATREKAASGADVVQRAVKSIQLVQQQSLQLKQDMTKLDESAKSITQIMGVISDIADQTNLLALNAAIEAARAGEAGRGFAVVADEVRKLAEKTMASTSDVANAISAIQSSATHNMMQVDSAVKTIEEATVLANQSGEMLQEIVRMAESTADQVHSIATASEEQSATSEEINHSMGQVSTIADETVEVMEEAAQAVSNLAGQAHILTDLIEDMKRA